MSKTFSVRKFASNYPIKSKFVMESFLYLPNPRGYVVLLFKENQIIVQHYSPCDENRAKIDDFIAILGPINCALNRDKSPKLTIFLYCSR
jgi:hypothetical protein